MKTKIHGFEMAYDDTGGSGTPLLLIHGFQLDRTLWTSQVSGLRDVARVIAPDDQLARHIAALREMARRIEAEVGLPRSAALG